MLDKVNPPDSACDVSIFFLTITSVSGNDKQQISTESTKAKNKRNGTINIDKVEQ